MKQFLLKLGAVALLAAFCISTVSCSKEKTDTYKESTNKNYTIGNSDVCFEPF